MSNIVQLQETNRFAPTTLFHQPELVFAVALVAAVFLAYKPSWQGGYLWTDETYLTAPELQSFEGLCHIWLGLDPMQHYHPVPQTALWLERTLWGDTTLGYHWVNLVLHAAAALLAACVLRQLTVPGAYLAAAVFALHPAHVQSVAWIMQQKTLLSAVLYLGAALAYLQFDRTRKQWWYAIALALFAAALLSKMVAATLPAALLVVLWWQRGRLSWDRDVLPLLPLVVLGAVGGIFAAYVEYNVLATDLASFHLTAGDRLIIAGRAVWFYLGKLLWPVNFIFMYPRWKIASLSAWQYLFPAAVLALLAALWGLRRRWRGPLTGVLFFIATLFPVLGFFNLSAFVYSFVANDCQYLASLGIIALVSAGIVLLLIRLRAWNQPAGYLVCLALLAALATLTWRQSRTYAGVETLYRATIAANPECAMAHTNLGIVLAGCGKIEEAITLFQKSLELNPDDAEAHYNYGIALRQYNRPDEAIGEFRKAAELRPNYANAHNGLGLALVGSGRVDEGISHYRQALEIEPYHEQAHYNLGNALAKQANFDEAISEYEKALQIKPKDANALNNLGSVLISRGQIDNAIAQFSAAARIDGENTQLAANLEDALAQQDRLKGAVARQRNLLRSRPRDTTLLNKTAWILATNPNASIRNGSDAVRLALRAVELSNSQDPDILGTLAAAYAETEQFPEAVETAQKAIELATQQDKPDIAESIKAKLALYKAGTPFRELQSPAPRSTGSEQEEKKEEQQQPATE